MLDELTEVTLLRCKVIKSFFHFNPPFYQFKLFSQAYFYPFIQKYFNESAWSIP